MKIAFNEYIPYNGNKIKFKLNFHKRYLLKMCILLNCNLKKNIENTNHKIFNKKYFTKN